tara:strand:+ start:1148 stop:1324 length:177 start_codon:yes stop_codon:yes gene_type:complete
MVVTGRRKSNVSRRIAWYPMGGGVKYGVGRENEASEKFAETTFQKLALMFVLAKRMKK